MLHKVNLPSCVPQLEEIVKFQREVLRAACEGDYQFPFIADDVNNENNIKTIFGDDRGAWFWKKLWSQPTKKDNNGNLPPKKKTTIHTGLEKLTAYYQQNSQEGIATLSAFDNDIQFADKLNDADFRFKYPDLEKNNQELIKLLMITFYEDLLAAGFIAAIHGGSKKLDRDGFIASYWSENVGFNVCSACDRERSDVIDFKIYDDADHFLPKSKYPFLSLHPYNLFPLCVYCNRSFKGDRDIIDDHNDAPLANIFHPYKRTVLEKLDLKVYRDQKGVSKIGEFTDSDGMPSRKMNSLNKVFKLNERWVDRLRIQKENIVDFVLSERANLERRRLYQFLNDNELKEMLIDKQKQTFAKFGKKPGYVVQNSYLTCVLSDTDEFEELSRYFAP
ncbi:MAG: hypothetical protein R3E32_13795 [Chitinophagales bacterium]